MMRRQQDQQSKVFYELSALILNLLRNPTSPIDFSDDPVLSVPATAPSSSSGVMAATGGVRRQQMGGMGMQHLIPAGFASLMLGISLALMLCGSLTFFIGFILMPWVLGLVMGFYVVGVVSSLSMLGRNFLCHNSSSTPSSPRKDCSS